MASQSEDLFHRMMGPITIPSPGSPDQSPIPILIIHPFARERLGFTGWHRKPTTPLGSVGILVLGPQGDFVHQMAIRHRIHPSMFSLCLITRWHCKIVTRLLSPTNSIASFSILYWFSVIPDARVSVEFAWGVCSTPTLIDTTTRRRRSCDVVVVEFGLFVIEPVTHPPLHLYPHATTLFLVHGLCYIGQKSNFLLLVILITFVELPFDSAAQNSLFFGKKAKNKNITTTRR